MNNQPIIILGATAWLVLTAALGSIAENQLPVSAYVDRIKTAILSQNLEQARGILKDARLIYTDSIELLACEADIARESGAYEQAVHLYVQYIARESKSAWQHAFLGYCYWKLGRPKAAGPEYVKALVLFPENAVIKNMFLDAVKAGMDLTGNIDSLGAALDATPDFQDQLIKQLYFAQRFNEVVVWLSQPKKILSLSQLYLLSEAYYRMGDLDKSLRVYLEKFDSAELNNGALDSLTAFLSQNQLCQRGLAQYSRWHNSRENELSPQILICRLQIELKEYPAAISTLDEIMNNALELPDYQMQIINSLLVKMFPEVLDKKYGLITNRHWPWQTRMLTAKAYEDNQRMDQAMELYQQMISENTNQAASRVELARLQKEQHRYLEAYEQYLAAARLAPEDENIEEAWLKLICQQNMKTRYLNDMKIYQERDKPDLPQQLALGRRYWKLGYEAEGSQILINALLSDTADAQVQSAILNWLRKFKMSREIAAGLKIYLKKSPPLPLQLIIADYYRDNNLAALSIPIYLEAMRYDKNLWIKLSLAICYEKENQIEKASEQIELIFNELPEDISLLLALYEYCKRHPEKMTIMLNRAQLELSKQPGNLVFMTYLGMLEYKINGRKDQNNRNLETAWAEAEKQNHDQIMYVIADNYLAEKQEDKTIALLKKMIEKKPDAIPAILRLARIYNSRYEFNETRELLQNATHYQPAAGQIYELLGDMYRQLDDPYFAEQNYKQAILLNSYAVDRNNILNTLFPGQGYRVTNYLRLSAWDEYYQEEKTNEHYAQNGEIANLSLTWSWKNTPTIKTNYQLYSIQDILYPSYSYFKHILELSSSDMLKVDLFEQGKLQFGGGVRWVYTLSRNEPRDVIEQQNEGFANLNINLWRIGNLSGYISYAESINQVPNNPYRKYLFRSFLTCYRYIEAWEMSISGNYYKNRDYVLPWQLEYPESMLYLNLWKKISGPISLTAGLNNGWEGQLNKQNQSFSINYNNTLMDSLNLSLSSRYGHENGWYQGDFYAIEGEMNYNYQLVHDTRLNDTIIQVQDNINFGLGWRWINYWPVGMSERKARFYLRLFM